MFLVRSFLGKTFLGKISLGKENWKNRLQIGPGRFTVCKNCDYFLQSPSICQFHDKISVNFCAFYTEWKVKKCHPFLNRHATSLLYHVHAVASRNKWFISCGTSGKLILWTPLVFIEIMNKKSLC